MVKHTSLIGAASSCFTQSTAAAILTHVDGSVMLALGANCKDNYIHDGKTLLVWTGYTGIDTHLKAWFLTGGEVTSDLLTYLSSKHAGLGVPITVALHNIDERKTIYIELVDRDWKMSPPHQAGTEFKSELVMVANKFKAGKLSVPLNQVIAETIIENGNARAVLRNVVSAVTGDRKDSIIIQQIACAINNTKD